MEIENDEFEAVSVTFDLTEKNKAEEAEEDEEEEDRKASKKKEIKKHKGKKDDDDSNEDSEEDDESEKFPLEEFRQELSSTVGADDVKV